MTDKEIIKALERITQYSGFTDDVSNTLLSAIDLINRQQAQLADERAKIEICAETISRQDAEIDSLRVDLKRVCAERDAHICTNNFIKSEAIKEFAEKLKKRFYLIAGRCVVNVYQIDNLVKEYEKGSEEE